MKPTKAEQDILDEFRAGPCEICNRLGPTDPMHIKSRGAGVANIRCNIIAGCRTCHGLHHSGGISSHVLMCIVAIREGMTIHEIEAAIWYERKQRIEARQGKRR